MRRLLQINVNAVTVVLTNKNTRRRGFTLIELLVVIAIILILTAVTAATFNFSVNADRVRSGARQFQSLLAGARDKAIYAKEIRGVRLLLDQNDNHAVSAVQYIGSPQRVTGTLFFDSTGSVVTNATSGPNWYVSYIRGLLRPGTQIQIPSNTGTWYTVSYINVSAGSGSWGTVNSLTLNRPNRDFAGSSAQVAYTLQLAPGVLDEAQPVSLPRGVVIDLDGSNVPSTWRPASFAGGAYGVQGQMDILFTPRGTVVGDALSVGMLHLHFADAGDVVNWHSIVGRNTNPTANTTGFNALPFVPVNDPTATKPTVKRDRILASLATRTGSVSVHYVYEQNAVPAPSGANPSINYAILAVDPYRFAETGQVANK